MSRQVHRILVKKNVYISGVGDLSIWDFSGYEPYYMIYDRFLGDTNCVHVVMFSLMDTYDEQIAQVFFWLNFLKARVTPLLPLGMVIDINISFHIYFLMRWGFTLPKFTIFLRL